TTTTSSTRSATEARQVDRFPASSLTIRHSDTIAGEEGPGVSGPGAKRKQELPLLSLSPEAGERDLRAASRKNLSNSLTAATSSNRTPLASRMRRRISSRYTGS